MAIVGVSKLYYAKYAAEGGSVSYSGGGVMGKATQVDVEIETSEANELYADNAVAETDRQFSGGTLTVAPDELSQEVSKVILGLSEQAVGEVDGITDESVMELVYDDDQATPYLGVGFIIKKQVRGVTKWRAVMLTRVMFAVPKDAATTQKKTIEWQVPELTATIMRDESTKHAWKREATFTTELQAEAYIKNRLNITEGP